MSLSRIISRRLLCFNQNRPALSKIIKRSVNYEGETQAYAKSEMNILGQDDPNTILVKSYNILGFKLSNGVRIIGPCALFPRTVLGWNVRNSSAIDQHSLSLFHMLEPKLDILIIGIGDRGNSVDRDKIMSFLHTKKINVEIQPTEEACAMFNFLNAEGRYVAAGLLPPSKVVPYGDPIGAAIDGDGVDY